MTTTATGDSSSGHAAIGGRELLTLRRIGDDRFAAVHNLGNGRDAIFGGQVLLQALAAATQTVPDWAAHTFTGYFLRAGRVDLPVDYVVERVRDGRRYAARRVVASQHGKPIHDMLCSFHDDEDGPRHQFADPPAIPRPDALIGVEAFIRAHAERLPAFLVEAYRRPFPVELRLVDPEAIFFEPARTPERHFWFRMPSARGIDDPRDRQALLAFMSDFWFAGAAGALHVPAVDSARFGVVTLNHSVWLHAPVPTCEWLLFRTESPWAGEGRGLVRGMIYDGEGRLIATAAQEISIRAR